MLRKTRRLNPLLLQEQSHFASQNKEDHMYNKVETNMNFVDREKQTEKFKSLPMHESRKNPYLRWGSGRH